jgi:hypothetical protein
MLQISLPLFRTSHPRHGLKSTMHPSFVRRRATAKLPLETLDFDDRETARRNDSQGFSVNREGTRAPSVNRFAPATPLS